MNSYFKVSTSIAAALFIIFLSVGGAYGQDCTNDSTPPTVTCGPPTTVFTDASGQAAIPNLAASVTASDNCTAPESLIRTQSPAAGTLVGVGTYTITVTVTDAARNSNTCQTTLTVAAPRPTDVRVLNAPTEPVPTVSQGTTTVQGSVRLEGTPNVNVANTATVNLAPGSAVRVDGTPTVSLAPGSTLGLAAGSVVSVAGTPTVNLAPRSEVGLAAGSTVAIKGTVPVSLLYSPLQPLSTCNICEPLVQAQKQIVLGAGQSVTEEVLFTVPSGRRLVIEFVTISVHLPSLFQGLNFAYIATTVNGVAVPHFLDVRRISLESQRFVASQPVRIYADAGTDVNCAVERSGGANGTVVARCTMSGYLVDMP